MISAEGLQRLLNLPEPPSEELMDVFSVVLLRVGRAWFMLET